MIDIDSLIIEEGLKTFISIVTTGVTAGAVWLLCLRYRSRKLKKLILHCPKRYFELYYRGSSDPSKKKKLNFLENGCIENNNEKGNESYWKIRYGFLEILSSDKKIYSKFSWNRQEGKLIHTNDPKLPSVMGQYILPLFSPRK